MRSLVTALGEQHSRRRVLAGSGAVLLAVLLISLPLLYLGDAPLPAHRPGLLLGASITAGALLLLGLIAVLHDLQRSHTRIAAENRALAETLSLNQAILNTTSDAILVVDLEDRPVVFNQRFVELWRIPPALAKRARREAAFRTAEFRAAVLHMVADPEAFLRSSEALYRETEATVRDTLFLRDGRRLLRYSSAQRVGGAIVGRIWTFHDITELHREKERLELFRQLIDGSHDALLIVDPITSEILDCNARAAELHGYTRADFLQCRLIDLNAGIADTAAWRRTVHQIEQQGTLLRIVDHYRADGTVFPLEITARAVSAGGRRYVVATERDLSRRRAMEVALARERDFAQLLFDTQDTLLAVLQDNRLLSCNQAMRRFIGIASADEAAGCDQSLLERVVEGPGYLDRRAVRAWLQGGGDSDGDSQRLQLRAADAQRIHAFLARRRQLPGPDRRQLVALTDISELEAQRREIEHLAATDTLTGLLNRNRFNAALGQQLEMVRRYGARFSLAMFDVDRFKAINDTLGHLAGDLVLQQIGRLLRRRLRAADTAARWGGDEFMILMPETDIQGARAVVEGIRETLELADFGLGEPLRNSFGITQATGLDTPESLVARVDEAMYRAKRGDDPQRLRIAFPVVGE
jgi:diguanylate cyclase (GGDEF)-like protein/PAS domain S-box-containing protein